MIVAAFVLMAYLLGSVSFGVVASRIFGLPDPRTYGSRNPGATNVLRGGKKAAAALTLLGDTGKGWLSVLLARYFAPVWEISEEAIAAVALAVFLGHLFPLFLRFQGGKGVATALGVLLGFNPWMGAAAAATWLMVAAISRISSLSALAAAVLAPIYALYFQGFEASSLVVFIMSLLLVWRHRSNISSLIAGKEERIGERSMP